MTCSGSFTCRARWMRSIPAITRGYRIDTLSAEMPAFVNCPGCKRSLRVPDALLGQVVKCPTCLREFDSLGPPPVSERTAGAETRIRTQPAPMPSPELRPIPFEDDLYDERDDAELMERRTQRLVKNARQRVAGLANGLFAVGVINLIAAGYYLFLRGG